MTAVVVFHHALGLTEDVRAFVRELGAAVHTPDLYEGRTFATLEEGIAHAEQVGFETIIERGRRAAERLPADVVYVGLSLGVLPAQMLAQTRPGARGAVLLHSCVDPAELGGAWPAGVPLQIHMMDGDPLALPPNEDLAAARRLAEAGAELFVYQGDQHLLTDYDEAAAALVMERMRAFLASS